jgi:hypothetical protein
VAGGGPNDRDKADGCCKCNQEKREAFHIGSSSQYASVNEIIFFKADQTRIADAKQLDDSIGKTFVSVYAASVR